MERFFEKIDKTKSCWIWTGAKRNKSGYGAIKINGKIEDTHRLSYVLKNGEIPKGMLVCHTCDNPSCVNPDHLFLGTHKDNTQDCIRKKRFSYPKRNGYEFKKGHIKSRVVPDGIVLSIKKDLLIRGKTSLIDISKKHNVKYQTVRDISCGRSYKNILITNYG